MANDVGSCRTVGRAAAQKDPATWMRAQRAVVLSGAEFRTYSRWCRRAGLNRQRCKHYVMVVHTLDCHMSYLILEERRRRLRYLHSAMELQSMGDAMVSEGYTSI